MKELELTPDAIDLHKRVQGYTDEQLNDPQMIEKIKRHPINSQELIEKIQEWKVS